MFFQILYLYLRSIKKIIYLRFKQCESKRNVDICKHQVTFLPFYCLLF